MKKPWNWIIAVLLLANLVFLSLLLFQGKPAPGRPGIRPDQVLAKELQFDAQQEAVLKELDREHRANRRVIQDRTFQVRQELVQVLVQEEPKTGTQDSLVEQLGDLQTQLEQEVIRHFRLIRELCTDAQGVHFDELVLEMLPGSGGQGGPRRGPPPRNR